MEKETLEEAAEWHSKITIPSDYHSFIKGANWQAKRMYSEEDLREAIQLARLCTLDGIAGDFVDLGGLAEICTYGLEETHSEDSIIEQVKKK